MERIFTVLTIGVGLTLGLSGFQEWSWVRQFDRSHRAGTFTLAPAQAQSPSSLDLTVIPRVRVGAISATTTYADLTRLFGADKLSDRSFDLGEGFMQPATRVDLGEARSLTVIWENDRRTQVLGVGELGSDWKTPEGIGMGTSLQELQEILGSFQLAGFEWDYAGAVLLDGTKLEKYQGWLYLQVLPDREATERFAEDYRAVIGDELFDSTNSHMQALNPTVRSAIVQLEP